MSNQKQKKDLYYVHSAIGLAIMAIFWFMPPIDPITPIGMKCVGIFLMMVYLWSMVDTLWPSILGLFMFGISGFDPAGFNSVWMNSIGNFTVLLTMLACILFGAVHEVGDTMYIAQWFLTKKIFKGRPWVFLAIWFACCAVVSALIGPIVGLIILWPIALSLMKTLNITREDKVWPWFFVGTFLINTLMQPFFPFMGAQLVPLSAFQGMTAQMYGAPLAVPMAQYMITNATMSALIMAIYMAAMKFIIRVDVSKLQAIDPDMVKTQLNLPPINKVQIIYLVMIPIYISALLIPSFIPNNPICQFLLSIGSLGVTVLTVAIFLIVKVDGKPLLDFKEMAYKQLPWGIFFMIAAAVYGANSLSNASTGVTAFLLQVLNPILGGLGETAFVAVLFLVALIITNFANNAAMAVVLMPVVLAFSQQMNLNPIPVAMGVTLMVFVAMLTPAASPHAGMMHGRKDIYTTGEILKIGLPMCLVTWALYVFVGYPMMKLLLGV